MILSNNYLVIDSSVSQVLSIICFFLHLQIDTLLACGGLAKNPLFLQQHADIIGILSVFLSLHLPFVCGLLLCIYISKTPHACTDRWLITQVIVCIIHMIEIYGLLVFWYDRSYNRTRLAMFVCNQILFMSRSEKSFALQRMLVEAFWHFLTQIDELVAFLLIIGSGCPIILPREKESVLLGAAILGAVAAKRYSSLFEAMKAMNAAGQVCMMVFFFPSPLNVFVSMYILQGTKRQKFAS